MQIDGHRGRPPGRTTGSPAPSDSAARGPRASRHTDTATVWHRQARRPGARRTRGCTWPGCVQRRAPRPSIGARGSLGPFPSQKKKTSSPFFSSAKFWIVEGLGWGWSLVQNNNLAHKGTATCHHRPLRSSALSSRVVASALDSAATSAGRRSSRSPWEQAFGREARRVRAPGRRHRRGVGRRSCAAFALVVPPQCLAYSVLQPPCARNPEITETSEIPWNSRQCQCGPAAA